MQRVDIDILLFVPNSPVMPVTLNRGMRMHSWFDVFHLGDGSEYDVESLSKAAAESEYLLFFCPCIDHGS